MLFYETNYEESNINRKHFIWSQDKIITKFGQKNWATSVLAKLYETAQKLRKIIILRNLQRREQYQPETPFLVQKRIITKFRQKNA